MESRASEFDELAMVAGAMAVEVLTLDPARGSRTKQQPKR